MLAAKNYEWNIFAKVKASLPLENYRETNVLARTWILIALVQIINFELNQMPNSVVELSLRTALCEIYFQHEVLLP